MTPIEIINEAIKTAEIASRATLDQLQAHGPKYTIHESDITSETTGPVIDSILDLCGGAYINVSGNSSFVRELKKIGKTDLYGQWFKGKGWSLSKGAYKGYTLHIDFTLQRRQEARIHENAMKAAIEVLKSHDIPATLHTYID